jgi:hypothetical protein
MSKSKMNAAKMPEREAHHSLPSIVEVKTGGAIPPLPQYVFMTWYLTN